MAAVFRLSEEYLDLTAKNSDSLAFRLSERNRDILQQYGLGFAAGAAYGLTSVAVGQPLDTVKTRMQAMPDSVHKNSIQVALDLFKHQGFRGLYRGGLPVCVGGTLFRSAQFGVYEVTLKQLKESAPAYKIGGVVDWQVTVAGLSGGFARGIIETPVDFIKISSQVERRGWSVQHLLQATSVTLVRNSLLFGAFSIYRDVIPPLLPGSLSPFWVGALSSNLAWLTIWPLDVIKSQRQSGNFSDKSSLALLRDATRSGLLWRGLLPGLARSTLANGCAMVAYKKIEELGMQEAGSWSPIRK
jgi:hypothetical protein